MFALDRLGRAVIEDREAVGKFLLGGVLSFVPVVNLFALGYLFRFARQVRRLDDFSLPAWEDWGGLFVDGLRCLGVAVAFAGLPIAAAWAFRGLVINATPWLPVSIVAEFPFALAIFLGPILAVAALFRLQRNDDPADLLRLDALLLMLRAAGPRLLVPGLVFMALAVGFRSIYGLSIFLGSLLLIGELMRLFVDLERDR